MMEDWKEHKFSEIADFPPKIKMEKGKEYPFVLMDEVDAGFKYVRASFTKKYDGSGAKFENGDTLFARITPSLENGKIAQIKDIDRPAFGSTEFFVFRGKKNISDSDFIYYLSKTDWFRQNAINSFVGASGRQRADAKFVGKTILKVPPLPTQQKIAKILSAYDDLIENNLQRIKLLEEMAQITYEEWFIRMKFPGHETAKFDEETGLPEGWKHLKVKDIADFQNGYAFYTKGYSTKGYPVIDLGNISEFGDLQITGNEKLISEELYKASTKFQLMKNDIVMAMTDVTSALRILAKSGIIDKDNTYVLNQRVGMFRPKTKDIDYSFLYAVLNDRRLIGKMKAVSKGAVQFYFNTKDIVNYMTFLPRKSLIDEFVKIYKPILEIRIKLKDQNQYLKEARDILLPRLMTGMIDVEKISGQVASETERELTMAAEDGVEYKKL
jgi:type I restriction enzyme S subunit